MIKVGRGGEDDLSHFYHLFFLFPSLSPSSSPQLYRSLLLFMYNETLLAIMRTMPRRGILSQIRAGPFFFIPTGLERINNSSQLSAEML
jgi:hypothetical protein